MKNTSLIKSKKIWGAAIVAVLFSIFMLPIQAESSDWSFSAVKENPVVVDGRILTKDKTGDVSDWVEIARNGKYSLIVRKNFFNQQEFNYGDPEWQNVTYGFDYQNNEYSASRVRKYLNHWFNVGAPIPNTLGISGAYDVLPYNARLRDYTMQHNATIRAIGTASQMESLTDGISKPTKYQVGIGNDITFALSFGEVAEYASKLRFIHNVDGPIRISPPLAVVNFEKIAIPTGPGAITYSMWLRSPGSNNTASSMASNGTVYQSYLNPKTSNEQGFIYPAVWVDSAIFGNEAKKPVIIPPASFAVDGRVLTKEQTGDVSEWVEIAQSNGYSLIVRKNFINIQEFNYNNPPWQSINYGYDFKSNDYLTSRLRRYINHWFNILTPIPNTLNIPGVYDVLGPDARLRRFTMQSNAVYHIGTGTTKESLNTGLSRPSIYQTGVGDDVAFALSYGEAANYLSKAHFIRNAVPAQQPSTPIAVNNYNKISVPSGVNNGMWLRSPGDLANHAAALGSNEYNGTAFQMHVDATSTNSRGFIYPALWVGEGIFGEDKATIRVFHLNADTRALLEEEIFEIDPGNYGPYNAKTFTGFGAGYLAPDSDPHIGVVSADETKSITYLYPPYIPMATIRVFHRNADTRDLLQEEIYEIAPGNYGPYYARAFTGFSSGYLAPDSDPHVGFVNAGETKSVTYLYPPYIPMATIRVFHRNADTRDLLQEEIYEIAPGNYGPYYARAFTGFSSGYLAPDSDPHVGFVNAGETKSVTYLYPPYIPPVYVYYNSNYPDGTNVLRMVAVTPNTYYTIEDQGFTFDLYEFADWNTYPDGRGFTYNNGQSIYVTGNIYLYAQWKRKY